MEDYEIFFERVLANGKTIVGPYYIVFHLETLEFAKKLQPRFGAFLYCALIDQFAKPAH